MLIKVITLQSRDRNINVRVDNRNLVALIDAEVERLDVIVMREDTFNFCLDEDVWNERS